MNIFKDKRYLLNENGERVAHVHFLKDKVQICKHARYGFDEERKIRLDKESLIGYLELNNLRLEE